MSCGCYQDPCDCNNKCSSNSCSCEVNIDAKEIKWSGTCQETIPIVECEHLESIICKIDTILTDIYNKIVYDFLGTNVGGESEVYKGNDVDGFPEFRTLKRSVSVIVTQNENTIDFSVDETWLTSFVNNLIEIYINNNGGNVNDLTLNLVGTDLQLLDKDSNVISQVDLQSIIDDAIGTIQVTTSLNGVDFTTTVNASSDTTSLQPIVDLAVSESQSTTTVDTSLSGVNFITDVNSIQDTTSLQPIIDQAVSDSQAATTVDVNLTGTNLSVNVNGVSDSQDLSSLSNPSSTILLLAEFEKSGWNLDTEVSYTIPAGFKLEYIMSFAKFNRNFFHYDLQYLSGDIVTMPMLYESENGDSGGNQYIVRSNSIIFHPKMVSLAEITGGGITVVESDNITQGSLSRITRLYGTVI